MIDTPAILAIGFGGYLILRLLAPSLGRSRRCRRVLEALEFRISAVPGGVYGSRGDLRIQVSLGGGRQLADELAVFGLGWGPDELAFHDQAIGDHGDRELVVGEPGFDAQVALAGDPPLVLALLDAATRRLVVNLVQGRLLLPGRLVGVELPGRASFRGGALRVELRGGQMLPEANLESFLEAARALVKPADPARRLRSLALSEPSAGPRLVFLAALSRHYPGNTLAKEALRAALVDPSEEIRLHAAVRLAGAGRSVLEALLDSSNDSVRARALRGLAPSLDLGRCLALLTDAVESRQVLTARACLELLAARGPETIPRMVELLRDPLPELAAAAATALGATGDPAAEPALLGILDQERWEVGLAAVRALARVGTAAAVLPLKRFAQHGPATLRRDVLEAVATVQARLLGAEHGQLSLAGVEPGRLSLADDQGGRVSLAAPWPAG